MHYACSWHANIHEVILSEDSYMDWWPGLWILFGQFDFKISTVFGWSKKSCIFSFYFFSSNPDIKESSMSKDFQFSTIFICICWSVDLSEICYVWIQLVWVHWILNSDYINTILRPFRKLVTRRWCFYYIVVLMIMLPTHSLIQD